MIKDFVFSKLGHKKPRHSIVDFGQQFDPHSIKDKFGIDDHSAIEAAHDTTNGNIYINSKAKNTDGSPMSLKDGDAALKHENVHYQINKLAATLPDPEEAKTQLSGAFIKDLGLPLAKKIGQYIDKVHSQASNGKSKLTDDKLSHEIIPHLASITTPGSSHRSSFMKHHKLTDEDMKPYDEGWDKMTDKAHSISKDSLTKSSYSLNQELSKALVTAMMSDITASVLLKHILQNKMFPMVKCDDTGVFKITFYDSIAKKELGTIDDNGQAVLEVLKPDASRWTEFFKDNILESEILAKSVDPMVARVKNRYLKPKKPTFKEQVADIKERNTPPKEPPFEEQIEDIKRKYKDKVKKMGMVANAGSDAMMMSEETNK